MNFEEVNGKLVYKREVNFPKNKLETIKAALESCDKKYFAKYKLTYQLPGMLRSFFNAIKITQVRIPIQLETPRIPTTLKTEIERFYARKSLDNTQMYKLLYKVFELMNAVNELSENDKNIIEISCFEPSLILVETNRDGEINLKLTEYVADIFKTNYKKDQLLYMSPQQIKYIYQKTKEKDPNNLCYSMAVLAHKMFTNTLPFSDKIDFQNENTYGNKTLITDDSTIDQQIDDRDVADFIKNVLIDGNTLDLNESKLKNVCLVRYNKTTCNPNDFQIVKLLRTEGCCSIFKAKRIRRNENQPGEVLIKIFKFSEDMNNKATIRRKIENEYNIMKMCESEYFTKAYHLYYSSNTSPFYDMGCSEGFAHIIMEYSSHTLEEFLSKVYEKEMVPANICNDMATQLLKALWYLHGVKGVIHRSVYIKSIHVSKLPDGRYLYKLSDFSEARSLDNGNQVAGTVIGGFDLSAPEVQDKNDPFWFGYTYKSDLWMFAVTMYVVRTKFLPLSNLSNKCALMKKYQAQINFQDMYWEELPELKDLLQRIFVIDDYERIGWPEIHRIPFWKEKLGIQPEKISYSHLTKCAYKIKQENA